VAFGETNHPAGKSNCKKKANIMGDKSPKSTQKKSNQKNAKVSGIEQQKKQAAADKSAAGKKR
jgi:hypothetical protein